MGNNSSSSQPSVEVLIQAESLRKKARQFHLEAQDASNQSQHEYHHGDKAQAKVLSEKKKTLYNQMNENNAQAAQLIFNHYNKNRPNDEIDLHELYVNEALEYLQTKIDQCRLKSISQLKVITGIGNHSQENIAKIKPKVEQFAHKNNIQMEIYPGHIILNLSTNVHHNKNCIIL